MIFVDNYEHEHKSIAALIHYIIFDLIGNQQILHMKSFEVAYKK